jgi:hypothetical protein
VSGIGRVCSGEGKSKGYPNGNNFLKNGVSVSLVANSIETLTLEDVEELSRKIENNEI